MKKIVALALCLALALALCTVAFADAPASLKAKHVYVYYPSTDTIGVDVDGNHTAEFHAATAATSSEKGNIDYYSDGDYKYVVTTEDKAGFVLYTGGDYVYLKTAKAVEYTYTSTKYTFAYENDGSCGQYGAEEDKMFTTTDAAGDVHYWVGTKAEAGVDTGVVVYKGVIYTIATTETTTYNPHYAWKVTSRDANGVALTETCKSCGATAKVVTNAEWMKAAKSVREFDAVENTYLVITSAAAGTTAAGVTSAKTFDAGVALYAGMALMSVAGSAVVIGKKKEF